MAMNAEQFETLYNAHYCPTFRYVLSLVAYNHAWAEEITQSIFADIFFNGVQPVALQILGYQYALRYLRHEKALSLASAEEAVSACKRLSRVDILDFINNIKDERDRLILLHMVIHGKNQSETAIELGISKVAVSKRLQRLRARLPI